MLLGVCMQLLGITSYSLSTPILHGQERCIQPPQQRPSANVGGPCMSLHTFTLPQSGHISTAALASCNNVLASKPQAINPACQVRPLSTQCAPPQGLQTGGGPAPCHPALPGCQGLHTGLVGLICPMPWTAELIYAAPAVGLRQTLKPLDAALLAPLSLWCCGPPAAMDGHGTYSHWHMCQGPHKRSGTSAIMQVGTCYLRERMYLQTEQHQHGHWPDV